MGPDPKWSINALTAVLRRSSGAAATALMRFPKAVARSQQAPALLPILPAPHPCLPSDTQDQIPSNSMLSCSLRGIS